MLEKYWIKCPICNGKTRVQVFYNTVLRNFPLFCPKCKLTHIIDVEKLEIIIKNSEKQKEGYFNKIFCENWQNPVKQRITPHFLTTSPSNYYEFTTKE